MSRKRRSEYELNREEYALFLETIQDFRHSKPLEYTETVRQFTIPNKIKTLNGGTGTLLKTKIFYERSPLTEKIFDGNYSEKAAAIYSNTLKKPVHVVVHSGDNISPDNISTSPYKLNTIMVIISFVI